MSAPLAPGTPAPPSRRLGAIDVVRGLAMIIMALDHVREYFSAATGSPTDVATTSPGLFLTRLVTHFCAPTFVMLSGVSAALALAAGKPRGEQARLLATRGLWLIALEVTVVSLAWTFDLRWSFITLQVMWVIGVGMIVLAGLLYLPPRAVGALGVVMIVGHNALDGIAPGTFGGAHWLWRLAHEEALFELAPGHKLYALYPLVPWIGVLALGFALGTWYRQAAPLRIRRLRQLGLGALIAFVALRAVNVYGDLAPWAVWDERGRTVASFFNLTKYPPSLDFLLLTLGVAWLALAALDDVAPSARNPALVLGRVPLFYYVLHLYLIHALAIGVSHALGSPDAPWRGFDLPGVYLMWIVVVAVLYLPCRWFMGVKARRRDWWLSYL